MEGWPFWANKVIEVAPTLGLFFVMWFLQQREWKATLTALMTALREERKDQMAANREERDIQLAAMKEERENQRAEMREERQLSYQMHMGEQQRTFETQTRIFDRMELHGGILSRVEGKVDQSITGVNDIKHKILST